MLPHIRNVIQELQIFNFHCDINGRYFRGRSNRFMMMSSNGNIFRVTGLLCGEFTGPHKGQ